MTFDLLNNNRFWSFGARRRRSWAARGFTLIELLITITIIGLLAGLFLGALSRATLQANVVNTKATIAKLNTTIMQHWESYRTRPVPINPKLVLLSSSPQGVNARAWCYALWQQRGSSPNDPLVYGPLTANGALPNPLPTNPEFPNNMQLSAVRLLAIRELQKYEMPVSFDDFAIFTPPGPPPPTNPPPYAIRPPIVLPAAPPLAYAYLAKLNAATSLDDAQIGANAAAECLYMIMNTGSQDDALLGDHIRPDDIGDVDADGLPEFQDAWPNTSLDYSFATFPNNNPPPATIQVLNTRKKNNPISWIRWPAGFISDLQLKPDEPPYFDGNPNATPPLPPIPAYQRPFEFSVWRHDIFDPLKLDVPPNPTSSGSATPPPRGYQLFPLIYSAGPDGIYELAQNTGGPTVSGTNVQLPDPYYYAPTANNPEGQSGSWQDSPSGPYADGQNQSLDNITNHSIGTSARQ